MEEGKNVVNRLLNANVLEDIVFRLRHPNPFRYADDDVDVTDLDVANLRAIADELEAAPTAEGDPF